MPPKAFGGDCRATLTDEQASEIRNTSPYLDYPRVSYVFEDAGSAMTYCADPDSGWYEGLQLTTWSGTGAGWSAAGMSPIDTGVPGWKAALLDRDGGGYQGVTATDGVNIVSLWPGREGPEAAALLPVIIAELERQAG
jgi:hypothetical protein